MKPVQYKDYFLCFLAGFLYCLGFPLTWSPSLFFAPIIGMSIFLNQLPLISPEKLKTSLIKLLLFSFSVFLFGYYWIPHTMKEFGNIPFPLNYFVGSLFSLIVFPQYLVFILGLYFFQKKQWGRYFPKEYTYLKKIILALLLTLLEYFIPQQFPAHLGHAWMQLAPHLGLTPYFGYPIFSFFSFWMSLVILEYPIKRKLNPFFLTTFFIFIFLNFYFSLSWKPQLNKDSKKINIRLVQANIGNFLKLDSENGDMNSITVINQRYYEMSTNPSEHPLDLIIWPETSYPTSLQSNLAPEFIPSTLKKVVAATGAELFLGGYDHLDRFNLFQFETEYNTGFLIGTDGKLKDFYHKMKLIPFGEGLPFGPLNQYLARYLTNISFFAKGTKNTLFKTKDGTPFINAICYEILFSEFIRDFLNVQKENPQFIINLTNDSWYGKTSEPYHHLYLAKWRALEFQLPIIRMTNTGFSTIIFPDGSESKRTKLFRQETLDEVLFVKDSGRTLFAKLGIFSLMILGFFLIILKIIIKKLRGNNG